MKTISFKKLYHVGTLQIADRKASCRSSLEGPCLSVSQHPEEWRRIARLGGSPTWVAQKKENAFLNMRALTKTQRDEISSWGVAEGLISPTPVYLAWQTDEEGERRYSTHLTRKEAEHECCDLDDGPPDIEERPGFSATDKLLELSGQKIELDLAFDMTAIQFVDQVLGMDGLFWKEVLDPDALSAPRGGIVPRKIPEWTFTPL